MGRRFALDARARSNMRTDTFLSTIKALVINCLNEPGENAFETASWGLRFYEMEIHCEL